MTDEQTQTTRPAHGPRVIAERYAVLGELGRGGMGVVWRAEDRVIGRHVAIKELSLPDGADEAGVFQERVLREVRTGGRLNDPAVVTVYDVVAEGPTTYIVMELVEAPTLSDLVRQYGPMPPQQVAAIGEQVLSALQAAHDAGIVHRDVKPGNIMVAPNGRVKLTDFGIAQAVDDPRLTTSGMLVGSPAFMAPERVAGREALAASDLWSLGATLFFAVEGIVAFERSSTAATLHAIMNEVPYLTHAQGPLASAIMGLLITGPEARISAQQARGLLSMAGTQATPPGGQTALSPPPTMIGAHTALGPRPGAPGKAKRNWLLAGGALAAVALLAGGLFLGKWIFTPPADDQMLETFTYGQGGIIEDLAWESGSSSSWCLNTPLEAGRSLSGSNWVDCEESHFVEVYVSQVVVGGDNDQDAVVASFPGEQQVRKFGEAKCAASFHSNRIKEKDRDGLSYRALVPTPQEWDKRPVDSSDEPVRNVHCVVQTTGGGGREGSVAQKTS